MKKDSKKQEENGKETEQMVAEQEVQEQELKAEAPAEEAAEDKLSAELTEAKDKYLRLYSEFENFRRRTAKERMELIATASRDVMETLLPVLDDFERASQSAESEKATLDSVKEGIELIRNKFNKALEGKGLKRMEVNNGDAFNEDFHEAITQIPAGADMEGKVVDVVEAGYLMGDTVIRFAKVVTGAKQ